MVSYDEIISKLNQRKTAPQEMFFEKQVGE